MKTEKEKMLSGELYSAFDEELTMERERVCKLLHELNSTDNTSLILKYLIPCANDTLTIQPPFHCDYGYNISCGENVYFNANCVILDVVKVSIGSNVLIGPGVQIYTATHPLDYKVRRDLEYGMPVTIGDDCWIGGGSIILPGVKLGARCVIGAGSVVTKDVPPDTLAVGNPARVIKQLNVSAQNNEMVNGYASPS